MNQESTSKIGGYEFKHHLISDDEFKKLQMLIYREAGINLTDAKKCLVQTRIGKLMRKNNIDGYKQLFNLLNTDKSGRTLELVLDSISTNHTFFFREDAHFTFLADTILPDLITNQKKKKISIWSAACSSGEESYSIAITMEQALKKYGNIDYHIYSSDISITVLDKAKQGIYPLQELSSMPEELIKKYFKRGKGKYLGMVQVKKELKQRITFARHNLLEELSYDQSFDIVFCRNVMIYFDNDTKEKIVRLISKKMNNAAYFINGHSESLGAINHPFKMVKPTIYSSRN